MARWAIIFLSSRGIFDYISGDFSIDKYKRLREYILSKEPLCIECRKKKRIRPATVVDHIKPHKGDEELFYDESNLQGLCKSCHDRKTAKEDGRWKRRVYTY